MSSFATAMQSTKESNTSIVESKPAPKKVKVINRGSEIQKIRLMAEAARRPVQSLAPDLQSSGSKLKPENSPQAASKQRKASQSSTVDAIGKPLAKKVAAPKNSVSKTAASYSCSKLKKLTLKKQDELDVFPKGCNPLGPKKAQSTEEGQQRDTVLGVCAGKRIHSTGKQETPRPDSRAPKAATTKQYIPPQDIGLQRRIAKAINILKERRRVAQLALDGIFPLMKNNEAIEMAVAALEQQVDDCVSDIQQLKRLAHTSQTGSAVDASPKAFVTLASLGLDRRTTSENKTSRVPNGSTVDSGKGRYKNAKVVEPASSSNRALAAAVADNGKTTKRQSSARKDLPSTPETRLDKELFGSDPDSDPATDSCTTPITSPHIAVPQPQLYKSFVSSESKTREGQKTPVAHVARTTTAGEPAEKNKAYAAKPAEVGKLGHEQRTKDRSSAPKGNLGGIHPRSHMASGSISMFKKQLAKSERDRKRKRADVDDGPNKRAVFKIK